MRPNGPFGVLFVLLLVVWSLEVLAVQVRAADEATLSNGRSPAVNYMTECQGCHSPDGRGLDDRIPALAGHVDRFLATTEGRKFLVQVPGSANSLLSDADLAAVLNWIIKTMGKEKGAPFVPYTPSEVGRYRAHRLRDVSGTRAKIIAALPK